MLKQAYVDYYLRRKDSEEKDARTGFEKQSIHAIRRTVSSNLHKLGIPDATIAKMMGHSEKVNKQYYNYDVATLQEKLSLLNTCFSSIKEGTEVI